MDPLSAISIRSHFDRFPATIKGAFVLGGVDGDPHQVSIAEARLAPVGGRGSSIDLAPAIVDVAPGLDVFVPFEFQIADLPPGWYGLECEAAVDGVTATFPGGKRFCVAWPRAATRRGAVELGTVLAASGGKITVERVELAGDHSTVHAAVDPPEPPRLTVRVDGAPLPVLDTTIDEETGRGALTVYPVLRTQAAMRIEVPGGDGIDIRLP
ncbi:MAG: hypothetical protein WD206_00325 [Actinomycetota bacterium]